MMRFSMSELTPHKSFLGYIDGALKDCILSEGEWTVKLEAAADYGLSNEQAERMVVERCVEQGAVIERFEIRKLRDLIKIAAPDRVLEDSVQALLRRLTEERYHSSRPVGSDIKKRVARLVDDRLKEAGLHEEKELRQKIGKRLRQAAKPGHSIKVEEWRRIYGETLEELGLAGGETSDLVGLFFECRRDLGIEIAGPEPPTQPPPNPPPIRPRSGQLVEPPKPRPPVLTSLFGLVLVCLAVAVLVFFLLKFVNRGAGPGDGASITPPCDDECTQNLETWTATLPQDPSSKVRAVSTCEPYLSLSDEQLKRIARKEYPGWEWCDSQVILDAYQSGQPND